MSPPQHRPSTPATARRDALQAWIQESTVADRPTGADISGRLASAQMVHQLFLQELAGRLEAPLNEHLLQQQKDTHAQKLQLASWLNGALRQLDLAIECPSTGMPAILVVTPTEKPGRGRFQLKVSLPGGKRTKTVSMSTLPELHFTCRNVGIDKETLWQTRAGSPSGEERTR
jgi:hypothetical protein